MNSVLPADILERLTQSTVQKATAVVNDDDDDDDGPSNTTSRKNSHNNDDDGSSDDESDDNDDDGRLDTKGQRTRRTKSHRGFCFYECRFNYSKSYE